MHTFNETIRLRTKGGDASMLYRVGLGIENRRQAVRYKGGTIICDKNLGVPPTSEFLDGVDPLLDMLVYRIGRLIWYCIRYDIFGEVVDKDEDVLMPPAVIGHVSNVTMPSLTRLTRLYL
jgi:hypothetical protein